VTTSLPGTPAQSRTRGRPRCRCRPPSLTGSWSIEVAPDHNDQYIRFFRYDPDAKAVKNRLHLDIHASGERTDPIETRRKRVDAEASRLAGLGAIITGALSEEGLDHYAVGMKDPEGNEFDIN
jgi:hypothetical protein